MHIHPYCIVIPAIKKNAVIPDQLVKRLAGKTLIQRAIDTAKQAAAAEHIYVVTDSDEIRLICERNNINVIYDTQLNITSLNIVAALESVLRHTATQYDNIIIYRASSPLITGQDILEAYAEFLQAKSDCLVSVKSVKYRLWQEQGQSIKSLLFNESAQTAYVETKALVILRSHVLLAAKQGMENEGMVVTPYFLNDRSIEINSYQDWWLCEKILQSKHIVFVVAGYAAIGMGHIYRALMLAHEIADHRITFLCTTQSELAAEGISAKDYRTKKQTSANLAHDVLALRPDLVVNDILNTSAEYMAELKNAGIAVVNFEDQGEGAAKANLVVNALYEAKEDVSSRFLYGHEYFCLRDEFVHAHQNNFRQPAQRVLITFGGTDDSNYTRKTLDAILPLSKKHGLEIVVVTGPGYAHKQTLTEYVNGVNATATVPFIDFAHATNIMSQKMEGIDFAISSAGRTVYELAHMRIPAIVLSHHPREDMHTFARPNNGFLYLGIMQQFDEPKVQEAFCTLLDSQYRKAQFNRLCQFDFTQNKPKVIKAILALLEDAPQ